MTVQFARGGSVALFTIFAAQTAWADLTAKDVWAEWQSYMTDAGYEVSATETMSGNTLTIGGLTMNMEMPEGKASVSMGDIALAENGDGTVSVSFPATVPVVFDVKPEGEEPFQGTLNLTQSDAAMVVSGSPQAMTYDYSAAALAVALADLSVDGESIPADAVRAMFELSNVVLKETFTIGDTRSFDYAMTADAAAYDFAFDDPESEDAVSLKGAMQTIAYSGKGAIPAEMDTADMRAMLAAGFGFDGTITYAAGNSEMMGKGDGEDFAFASTSQGGSLGIAMDAAHLVYDIAHKGVQMTVQGAEIPFPVTMNLDETQFAIDMPLAKSDEEQPFAMKIKLGNFQVPEQLWGMVDPAGVLPRDAATIALDVAGKATVLLDLFDPALGQDPEAFGEKPGELNALTVNDLLVSAAGAKLSGTGDFTFDNSDLESFDGMPAPSGKANLQLDGANALLDKLIKMGLMSDQDAMGARMMMGMLAVPGDSPDSLKSEIVITDEGQILANGQRIK
ncbi:DUF2125 domain-containing protein [Seohaeicola saemankumensis]|nr:DUF2125 domain-containing protein [Seohaeicola saemankumensis]MCA0872653.1 DUF2125 domain-containing protein [Seohaeicola saemankumensis]